MANNTKKKSSGPVVDEKVWIERLTKKDEKKKAYEDPNTTFKP